MARRMIALAAVVALMLCSGAIGALAFSGETVVEVPVERETLLLEEIGLTLILPDSWNGQYALEKTERGEYVVYDPMIRAAVQAETGVAGHGGMLFYIMRWEEQLTAEQAKDMHGQWNFAGNQYIMTTRDGTYFLYYASDVQCTVDTQDVYERKVAEIPDVRFVVDHAFVG